LVELAPPRAGFAVGAFLRFEERPALDAFSLVVGAEALAVDFLLDVLAREAVVPRDGALVAFEATALFEDVEPRLDFAAAFDVDAPSLRAAGFVVDRLARDAGFVVRRVARDAVVGLGGVPGGLVPAGFVRVEPAVERPEGLAVDVRPRLTGLVLVALAGALGAGLAVGLAADLAGGFRAGFAAGLAAALGAGLGAGLGVFAAAGVLGAGFAAGLAAGLAAALGAGLATGCDVFGAAGAASSTGCGRSRSAAIPGSSRPSRNSRLAPPPVEMWVMLAVSPSSWTAATESPPPTTTVTPSSARRAR
jgi:hypothetical protein